MVFPRREKIEAPDFQEKPLWVLHLSDIHFRDPRYGLPRNKVFNRFMRALKRFMKSWRATFPKERRLAALFITGDIAYQSRYEDLVWAKELLEDILDETGIPGEHMYVVPGEHDVYLKYMQGQDDEMRFSGPADWNRLLKDERQGKRRKIEGRFSSYQQFLHDIGGAYGCRVPSASSDIYYADVFEHDGRSVAVLGLNSAWSCSCRLDDDRGMLCLGSYQVEDAYRLARRANGDQEPDLVISLFHHPVEWLIEGDGDAVEQIALRSNVIFRGHVHTGESSVSKKGSAVPVLSCSNMSREELAPGFLVAAIEPQNGKVHCWPYLWNGKEQAFLPPAPAVQEKPGKAYCSFEMG